MLKNYYSKYFYIIMIVTSIITVDCDRDPPPIKVKDNTYKLRDLERFNVSESKKFCESFDYVLVDVDVIFNDIPKINKAHVEILKRWENGGKKFIFYKTTMDDITLYTETLAGKLRTFGYNTALKILTPVSAFKWNFDKSRSKSGKAYVIGDDEFIEFVGNQGIETLYYSEPVSYSVYEAGINAPLDDKVKAVIIAFDVNINLYKMTQAIRYLNKSDVELFLTHPKSIFLANYYKVWIKKLLIDTKRTKSYIDQLDGMFGDYLIETNHLNDKVLAITTDASGNRKFALEHNYKPLLVGNWKVKKENNLDQTYYKVTDWATMPWC